MPAAASRTQILRHRLQVQHKLAVIGNILANLVHQKEHMMILSLLVAIFLHIFCKLFNRKAITFLRVIRPVLRRVLAHNAKADNCLDNRILHKIIVFSPLSP